MKVLPEMELRDELFNVVKYLIFIPTILIDIKII